MDASDPSGRIAEADLIRYAAAVYAEYLSAAGADAGGTPDVFVEWYRAHDFLLDRDAIAAAVGVDRGVVEAFDALLEAPFAANPVLRNWHRVALAHRGEPRHRLAAVQLAALLHWEDGRVELLAAFDPNTGEDAGEWTDGAAVQSLQRMAAVLCANLVERGLDAFHGDAVDLGDRADFDRFVATLAGLGRALGGSAAEGLVRLTVQLLAQRWVVEENLGPEARAAREARRSARPEARPDPLAESLANQIRALPEGDHERVLGEIAARDPDLRRKVWAALDRKV